MHHDLGRFVDKLPALVDKGLIGKDTLDRRTNVYSLTQRGQRAIGARYGWEDRYIADLSL